MSDQSNGIIWYNGNFKLTGTTGDGIGAGAMNTAMLIAGQIEDNPNGNFAAKVCADYSVTVSGVTYGDWYLPSKLELSLLYAQKNVVPNLSNDIYWSSTEFNNMEAWYQLFDFGTQFKNGKNYPVRVRAIRAF
jgi:5-methylthioribose kinase